MELWAVIGVSSLGTGQLQQVVGTTAPLAGDLRQAQQRALLEATSLFDLAKHGFDHLLA